MNKKLYILKADADKNNDPLPVKDEEVIGVVKNKIKFIGYPSVIIHKMIELFNVK